MCRCSTRAVIGAAWAYDITLCRYIRGTGAAGRLSEFSSGRRSHSKGSMLFMIHDCTGAEAPTASTILKEGGGSRKDREKGKGEHIAHGLRNDTCSCAAAFRFMQRRLVSL